MIPGPVNPLTAEVKNTRVPIAKTVRGLPVYLHKVKRHKLARTALEAVVSIRVNQVIQSINLKMPVLEIAVVILLEVLDVASSFVT